MDNLTQLKSSTILDNLPEDQIAAQFVGAHTFSDTLHKLVGGYRGLMNEILQLRTMVISLTEITRNQSKQIEMLLSRENTTPNTIHHNNFVELSGYTNIPRTAVLRPPRCWPQNFKSLGNVQMSNLIVNYLAEALYEIPTERNNKIQHKVIQAIGLANKFHSIDSMKIHNRKPTESEVVAWRNIAEQIQTSVINHIKSKQPQGIRTRGPTGNVEGILKMWSALRLDSSL